MAAFLLLLLLLLPPPAPALSEGPGCRLRWVPLVPGVPGCRGGAAGACVGHCESSAVPSPGAVLAASRHLQTSRGRCCTMARAHKVLVTLRCPGRSRRRLQTVSARSCRCDMCRQARY
ncbi:glycoprotein hormone alpha-2 [Pezoporus occidentalis]|uniref:glycoprotein hormone alpha-2 n=1 Tax=Pezoporus occidentalis TaxID=407982 RepID=UPI002F914B7A